jgi:hypothetical protein
MDPISTVSLIGASISIAKGTISGIKSICELRDTYSGVRESLSGLLSKLDLIVLTLSQLEEWVRSAAQPSNQIRERI